MAKPSKTQVTAKAEAMGIEVNPEWTVKEIKAAISSANSDTEVEVTSQEVESASPEVDSPVEPTSTHKVEVTPGPVFPTSGVRRLPPTVRLPHRGTVTIKHFNN